VLHEVFSRVFVHIYTAFWAVGVTRGFTLAEIRWKKRMSWTHPSSLTLQLINPFYVWTSRLRLSLRRYLSIISVCFSIIPTLTSFVWGLTLDLCRMLPMQVPRIQKTCMCGDPRTLGKQSLSSKYFNWYVIDSANNKPYSYFVCCYIWHICCRKGIW